LTVVKPSFSFISKTAFAGSPVSFQVSLHSQARNSIAPIIFSSAKISFNEQIPDIVVTHLNGNTASFQKVALKNSIGTADLSLHTDHVKVLEFSYAVIAQAQIEVNPLSERLIQAMSLHLSVESESHIFTIYFPFSQLNMSADGQWFIESTYPRYVG
jgi:Gryzun, putative trafficking through Golgi